MTPDRDQGVDVILASLQINYPYGMIGGGMVLTYGVHNASDDGHVQEPNYSQYNAESDYFTRLEKSQKIRASTF